MTMLELAVRCARAPGPDRELDCLVWAFSLDIELEWQGRTLVAGKEGAIGWIDPGKHSRNFHTNRSATGPAAIPAFTASIDAAMTLVPEGGWWELDANGSATVVVEVRHGDWDEVEYDRETCKGQAATPALALCTAALRARAAITAGTRSAET